MPDRQRQLIFNADDFGYSPGVSAGILYTHQYGVLTSTTAMVNTPFAKQGIEEAKRFPDLGMGLHFVLDVGHPVSSSVDSLTDHDGMFLKGTALIQSAKKEDIKQELEAQLNLLLEWDVNVTHLDSHHHMHVNIPAAREVVSSIARQYNLPVRSFMDQRMEEDIATTNHFIKEFYGEENISSSTLLNILSQLRRGVTEVMCHPAFMDPWLQSGSRYHSPRMKELETLTDCKVRNYVKEHGIELIHYGQLHQNRNKT